VFAIGYAGGWSWQTMTRHLATYQVSRDGLQVLIGYPSVIPGMSGGAVVNERGEVVGIINAYVKGSPLSFSRPLKDTSICPHS
jgi:S1-C subfamily serine protease